MMLFKDPWILVLIPLVLTLILFLRKRQKSTSFRFSSAQIVSSLKPTWRVRSRSIPYGMRLFAIVLFLIALAGPRSVLEESIHKTEGIDIVLTIDSSGSMAAEEFVLNGRRVNRLDIVKEVVRGFIDERKNDRLGLVTFASLAYTVSPLTTDHSWLLANLERINLGLIEDGTAIGSAISSSVARLENSEAKSKLVVLLTDGVNNAGKIAPAEAARVAKAFGVKIYTIGAGTKGPVPFPAVDPWGRTVYQQAVIDLDEKSLREIADITGGKYFRATDTESLREIYKEIDALEKIKIEEFGYKEYKELFGYFLIAALMILCCEMLLTHTVFLKVP
ncbi:MAG TPA: VWA domain-containing protein [Candidatus Omnitrophota bacterium]|nr:VWA domain-containing protein [Candidatus Omnitrophota bacterium]